MMVFVEYDRTRRVDKNFDKFVRYEAFLAGWWRHSSIADWAPPVVVFVCQDEEHALRFINAADGQLTAHHRTGLADGGPVYEYPARDRILFVLHEHMRAARPLAFQVPSEPPYAGRENRVRRVILPGI